MEAYNDGILNLYEDRDERTSFGAKKNEENLIKICTLKYKEISKRQTDQEFAQSQGFSLSLKVKTPRPPFIETNKKYKVSIENDLYDVSYYDMSKREIFLYLEFIRKNDSR